MSEIKEKLDHEMEPIKKICEKLETAVTSEFEKGVECIDTEEMGEVIDMLKDVYEAKEKIAKACYYKQIVEAMHEAKEEEEEQDKYMLRRFKEEAGNDEDKARRYYDNWRYADGRFAPTGRGSYRPRSSGRGRRGYHEMFMPDMHEYDDAEWDRDMDRHEGRMYYSESNSGGNMSGMSGNRSGNYNGSDGRRNYDGDGRRGNSERRSESRYDRARRGYEESKMVHNNRTSDDDRENMRTLEELLGTFGTDVIKEYAPHMSQPEKAMALQKLDTWSKMLKQ